eukprot:12718209-Alexandrium_andersonii.AAC.1
MALRQLPASVEGGPRRPVADMFGPPCAATGPDGSPGWWRSPWDGPNPPRDLISGGLELAWHGSPTEALYAIVGYGGLRGCEDGRAAVEGPG